MSILHNLLSLPFVQQLGWTLLHFIWQGILIGIACGTALRLPVARSARASYAISLSGLLLCAAAPIVTFFAIQPVIAPPALLAEPQTITTTDATVDQPDTAGSVTPTTAHADPLSQQAYVQPARFIPAAIHIAPANAVSMLDLPQTEALSVPWHERLSQKLAPYVPWLVVLWFPFALLLSLRLGWQWGQTRRWVRNATNCSPQVHGINLSQLCQRIGVRFPVHLLESLRIAGPLTVGFIKPVILVPIGFLISLAPEHIEAILLHELAHIRRRDFLINLLTSVITALLFYHPIVWWLDKRARLAREICCDQIAASSCADRVTYAHALTQLELWRQGNSALAMAANDGSLLQRIRALAGQRSTAAPSGRSLASLTAICALTLGTALLLQFTPNAEATDGSSAHTIPIKPAPNGIVIGTDGQPEAGATVALYHLEYFYGLDNGVVETVLSDSQGRFTFTTDLTFGGQDGEAWQIVAWLPEQVPAQAAALAVIKRNTVETQNLELKLSPPEKRTIKVVDKDGQAIAGASVGVHWWGLAGSQEMAYFQPAFGPLQTLSDAQGLAIFHQLPQGSITFNAGKTKLSSNWSGCDSGRDINATITLRPAASIEGRVVDSNGQPVADMLVYATPIWPLHDYAFTRTDANGNFKLEGLYGKGDCWTDDGGTGEYRFGIEHPEYCAISGLVKLESGQTKSNFNLVTWKGTPVSGILLDPETRQPIAGAQLSGRADGGDLNLITNKDGRFDFVAPPGRFQLSFSMPNAGDYVVENYVDRNLPHWISSEVYDKPLGLTLYAPSGVKKITSASGRILRADSSPAHKVRVVAELINDGQIVSSQMRNSQLGPVFTDAEGRFTFPSYPEGRPMRLITWGDGGFATSDLAAIHGADAQLPTVTLQPALSKRIRLVDIDGNLLVKQRIIYGPFIDGERLDSARSCPPVGYSLQRSATTDEEGYVTFRNLPEGHACDFWLVDEPTSWKRILPDQMQEEPLLQYTLSKTLRVQFLDYDNVPLPISRIETSESGFITGAPAYFHVAFSRENLSPQQQAEGWFEIPKESLSFLGPGAPAALWLETPGGKRLQVHGVFPQFENTFVMQAEQPLPETESKVTTPFSLGPQETAYRVIDDQGSPLASVSVAINDVESEHPGGITDADGWCVLKDLDKYPYMRYAKFTADGYAPQWSATLAAGEPFQLSMTRQTRLKGQFRGPDGAAVGTVKIRLETERHNITTDPLHKVIDGILYIVETDVEGRYDFPVSPGRYSILAESEHGYYMESDALNIKQGQTLSLPEAMSAGARVEMILTDSQTGKPVEGMRVYVEEEIGPAAIGIREGSMRSSDTEGRLVWESLPPKRTRFDFSETHASGSHNPYKRWWSKQHAWSGKEQAGYSQTPPRDWNGTSDIPFDLIPGQQILHVTTERGIHVSGKVILPEQLPAGANIIVTIVPVRNERSSFSGDSRANIRVENDTGDFSAWLPAGNGVPYRLLAYLAQQNTHHLPAALSEPFHSKPGEYFTFELSMLGGGYITGRLLKPDGSPDANRKLVAIPTDHAGGIYEEPNAITDAEGRFSFGPIRATDYGIVPEDTVYPRRSRIVQHASAPYREHLRKVTVTDGETANMGDLQFAAPE